MNEAATSVPTAHWSQSNTSKALILGLIALGLLVPLLMLQALIGDRAQTLYRAQIEVARGWGGTARLSPPFLQIHTERTVGDGTQVERRVLRLLPNLVDARATMRVSERRLGLHSLPVFLAEVQISGHFAAADLAQLKAQAGAIADSASLAMGFSDLVGVRGIELLRLGDQDLRVDARGTDVLGMQLLGSSVLLSSEPGADLPFELRLTLAGSQRLEMLPHARELRLQIAGDWPHPSYVGGLLPVQHSLDSNGFEARWQVADFNHGQPVLGEPDATRLRELGVGTFQPAGPYARTERSGKYGFLVVVLSFAALFIAEILLKQRLHPLHYLLIGLALAIFYLLLLALSEHLGFGLSYLLAATAVVVLLGYYSAAALGGGKRGLMAGALLGLTYAFLYGLIVSERFGLLAGALGLFAVLASIMLLTRRIDWYQTSRR